MKKGELRAGLSLLALVSGLCLAGLKAVDKKLAEKERKEKT